MWRATRKLKYSHGWIWGWEVRESCRHQVKCLFLFFTKKKKLKFCLKYIFFIKFLLQRNVKLRFQRKTISINNIILKLIGIRISLLLYLAPNTGKGFIIYYFYISTDGYNTHAFYVFNARNKWNGVKKWLLLWSFAQEIYSTGSKRIMQISSNKRCSIVFVFLNISELSVWFNVLLLLF